MGEMLNNVKCNYIECRLDNTDNNNNIILIKANFLPTPKLKLNYNYNSYESPNFNSSKAVTKFSSPKEKDPSSSEVSTIEVS